MENCKRKSNCAKGKNKTIRTQSLLNYGYSVDLPFRLELYQKSYMCLRHRVTVSLGAVSPRDLGRGLKPKALEEPTRRRGHAADSFSLQSDRQFGRLVRTCAMRLTAVLPRSRLLPSLIPRVFHLSSKIDMPSSFTEVSLTA